MDKHRHEEDARHTHSAGFTILGEIDSEEDGRFIGETLQELGITFEMFHGGSRADVLRRFFGEWHEGLKLIVKPQDAERALAALGSRLASAERWADERQYLEQRSTEQLVRLLDFRAIWKEPWEEAALGIAAQVLAARGVSYPPDGACSKYTPAVFLLATTCLGPFSLLFIQSNRMRRTAEGGSRPRYNQSTEDKLERCRRNGLIAWFSLYLGLMITALLFPPGQRSNPPQKSAVPAISAPRR